MNYDMEKAVKFCTAALVAVTHGKDVFVCPLCGATAHAKRAKGRLRARCKGCGERIEG